MRISEIWEHRSGMRILRDVKEFDELKDCIESLKTPVMKNAWRSPFDVSQTLLNSMLDYRMEKSNWSVQPKIDTENKTKSKMKGDFSKVSDDGLRIFVEVEFGNVASMFRDLYKFNLAYSLNSYDCGVFILPGNNLSKRIDTVQDIEKAKQLIIDGRDFINIPLVLIGLETDNEVNLRDLVDGNMSKDEVTKYWKTQSTIKMRERVIQHRDDLFIQI